MYNIKNPDRLDFIRKIRKERGINEIFSIEDAKKNDIVKIGEHSMIGACSYVDVDLPPNSHFVSEYKKIIHNFSKN